MEFLPKGGFHLRESQKSWTQAGEGSQKQEGRQAGGQFRTVLVERGSPCASGRTLHSWMLRIPGDGDIAQRGERRGLGRGTHHKKCQGMAPEMGMEEAEAQFSPLSATFLPLFKAEINYLRENIFFLTLVNDNS